MTTDNQKTATANPQGSKTHKAALDLVIAFGEAIKDMTEKSPMRGVPAGHLYATCIDKIDLETFNKIIGLLKGAGVVREENYLLSWVGGAK